MGDEVTLRPVREDDLALLERLTNDPEGAGSHEWHGWNDPHLWHHRWAENGLLGSAGGTLMVMRDGNKIGFVREGVLHGARFRDGRWHDDVLYSMLREEADPSAGR